MFLVVASCTDPKRSISPEVQGLPVSLKISRFEREFNDWVPEHLNRLKQKYPYLFPEQYPDSIWIAKHRDTLQLRLRSEVDAAFRDFTPFEAQLELLFKHVSYYFPNAPLPHVITLTTDVDYENRVLITDSLLFIGLDNYLGANHEFYQGLSRYVAKGLDSVYLLRDVAEAFAVRQVPLPKDRSFVSRMLYYGKILFVIDQLLPLASDAVKLGYSEAELKWAQTNEDQIWRYFVERELLFSTDHQLDLRFLDPAPFSKFRLELDSESPGQIGRYIGWQIVRSYNSHHSDDWNHLFRLSGEELFRKSEYKPPK
ncbi:MAG: hypothetical protein RLZZ241_1896 [Bacteroidota bacterium]